MYLYFLITNRNKMAQKDGKTGMNLQLSDKTHSIIFNHALEMSKNKKRKVPLPEAAVNIIEAWDSNNQNKAMHKTPTSLP